MNSPADRLVIARTRKLVIVHDKLADESVSRDETLVEFDELALGSRAIWDRRMEEWALAVATLQVPDARGLGRRIYDAACRDHQAMIAELK